MDAWGQVNYFLMINSLPVPIIYRKFKLRNYEICTKFGKFGNMQFENYRLNY
jgi:hypothetical protein